MRRVLLWLTGLIPVLAAAACGAGGSATMAASHTGHTYRDSAGWIIKVPPGWHVLRFSDSRDGITTVGVQLSNVKLPAPGLVPGFPTQANGEVLPTRGVGVVIATDTDPKVPHGPLAVPPLPAFDASDGWKYWNAGSASAGAPYIEILWFRTHSATFIATVKIGSKATGSDRQAVAAIIQWLH